MGCCARWVTEGVAGGCRCGGGGVCSGVLERCCGGRCWWVSLWWCLLADAGEVWVLEFVLFCPCYLVSMLVFFFVYCSFPLLETTIWYNLTTLDLQPAKQKHIALLTSPCFLTFKSPLADFWSLDFSSLRPGTHTTRSIIGTMTRHLRSWTGKRVGPQSWSIGFKVSSTRRFLLLGCCAVVHPRTWRKTCSPRKGLFQ